MNHDTRQQAGSVRHDDVALTGFDFLGRIITSGPPLSVVLTDWLSMMPTAGFAASGLARLQHLPLAAGSCYIQDRVDNGAPRFDQPPLRIGKVACVTLRTSDLGQHIVPHGLLDTTTLSQLTEITQLISGSASKDRGRRVTAGNGKRDFYGE
jgi:hypothetical protein